jgi:hypothetical protein
MLIRRGERAYLNTETQRGIISWTFVRSPTDAKSEEVLLDLP